MALPASCVGYPDLKQLSTSAAAQRKALPMTANAKHRSIVVGVDGTPGSLAALEFAFVEALDRGAPVVVVTTWMPDFPAPPTGFEATFDDLSVTARRMQDVAIGRVASELGEVPEYSQVVTIDVSGPSLIAAARTAALLVVGTGRKDRLSRAFMGSVSEFCVRHSPVPVVVVPAPSPASPFLGEGPTQASLADRDPALRLLLDPAQPRLGPSSAQALPPG